MPTRTLLTYTETLAVPDLADLYSRLGIEVVRVDSVRKALAAVKRAPPDFILAEFVYAWGNNYASCQIGNLDSLLASLPKYAPKARVILFAQRAELAQARRLGTFYPLHGILPLPASADEVMALLVG
ncbi:MAG: hypothetical protein WCC36_09985 [Gammaproteobacteria bacterium]